MFGEDLKDIEVFSSKEIFQLINRNSRNPNNFPINLIIFRNRQFIKSLIIHFQFINPKLIRKHKPLIIIPHFIHSLNKVIRIVSLYNELDFGLHIKVDKLPNMESNALIDMCTLLMCGSGDGEVVYSAIGYNKINYSRRVLWLSDTYVLFSTSRSISYLFNC